MSPGLARQHQVSRFTVCLRSTESLRCTCCTRYRVHFLLMCTRCIGKKTPSRPGPPVALVASAALDDTAPLRNPSGLMVCAPLWGIPSDAWPAVLVLAMLQPLVLVY